MGEDKRNAHIYTHTLWRAKRVAPVHTLSKTCFTVQQPFAVIILATSQLDSNSSHEASRGEGKKKKLLGRKRVLHSPDAHLVKGEEDHFANITRKTKKKKNTQEEKKEKEKTVYWPPFRFVIGNVQATQFDLSAPTKRQNPKRRKTSVNTQ